MDEFVWPWGLPMYPAPNATVTDLFRFWIVMYAALLFVYFVTCGFFHWMNVNNPERRIQTRPLQKNQISTEIKTSIAAISWIAFYLSGGLYCQAKGYTMAPYALLDLWPTMWTLIASLVIYDSWFYWGHRLLHTKHFYRFHSHHHKSVVPTPWANNSDTQVGDFIEQSYFLLAPFILPIHPATLLLHKLYDQITGIAGHAGHEYFAHWISRAPFPMICTIFHDQHHGHFNFNYANTFSWWDRLMGTLHPTYDDIVLKFEGPIPKEGFGNASFF